jgi:hypothetical protein
MFNHERPHEGLNNKTPGSIYQPSSMMLPRALIGYVYPKGFVIRRVNNSGDISWHKGRVFVSQVLRFEDLGFELVAEDFYKVFFRDVEIGEFEAEFLRFRPLQVSRGTQIPEYVLQGCLAAFKSDLPHFRCRVKLRLKDPKAALALSEARNLPAHTSAA